MCRHEYIWTWIGRLVKAASDRSCINNVFLWRRCKQQTSWLEAQTLFYLWPVTHGQNEREGCLVLSLHRLWSRPPPLPLIKCHLLSSVLQQESYYDFMTELRQYSVLVVSLLAGPVTVNSLNGRYESHNYYNWFRVKQVERIMNDNADTNALSLYNKSDRLISKRTSWQLVVD